MSEEAYPLAAPEDLRRYRESGSRTEARPMDGTDPPWMGTAFAIFDDSLRAGTNTRAALRAVLAFAAPQPRPITDAMVEAAVTAYITTPRKGWEPDPVQASHERMRAAIEAAEKARVS